MGKRRPSGDGMVRKRDDGRWEGRIVVGHKANGDPIFRHVYAKTQKALTAYLEEIQQDLEQRTASIPEEKKPTVYVGGVSFKGHHGFEGTEAFYGPFELIHAANLANTTGQTGAFNIDVEQVLGWDPEIIFLDFNGMELIREDYAKNPDFYEALTAVQQGRVYSQISFRLQSGDRAGGCLLRRLHHVPGGVCRRRPGGKDRGDLHPAAGDESL